MRVAITDSGVGGLAVCADVEARLRRRASVAGVELLYLNAALEDDYSYNSMPTREERLRTFDNFLHAAVTRFAPDFLFIACNTLSVLFRDPWFDAHRHVPILGIVEVGARELQRAVESDPDAAMILFATPTTIEEGVYAERLRAMGVPPERLAEQACPGLPDAISNDAGGTLASALLQRFVPEALAQFPRPPERVAAFLGCTHYGYQADLFDQELTRSVRQVRILNPNRRAGRMITDTIEQRARGTQPARGAETLSVRFISRYAVPEAPLRSLPHYLGKQAPATVAALLNFEHDPFFDGVRDPEIPS
jgi:glutamate racemase